MELKAGQIVYEFPSISETFVLSQVRGLIDRGWDVRIFADSAGSTPGRTRIAELTDRVRYFGLPFKNAREQVGNFKKRSAVLEPVSRFEPAAPRTNGLRLQLEARAFAGQGKFDVMHAHFGPNGVRAIRLRAKGVISAPVITSFYGYDVTRQWAMDGYGELFSSGDLFVALSETMRRQLIALGAPETRVVIHALGVDLSRFRKAEHSTDRLELISIARLVEKKGIEYGIAAVAKLVRKGVPLRYTIIGDGDRLAKLRELATRSGIAEYVQFSGAASQEKIAELLSRADILLAPSVTAIDGDSEGTPVAILEAFASGVPVVSTLHSAIPEIVQDGVSGFLVPERNDDALADRVYRLSEDAELRARMGEAGRVFVEKNHDVRKLNDKLARLYMQVKK